MQVGSAVDTDDSRRHALVGIVDGGTVMTLSAATSQHGTSVFVSNMWAPPQFCRQPQMSFDDFLRRERGNLGKRKHSNSTRTGSNLSSPVGKALKRRRLPEEWE